MGNHEVPFILGRPQVNGQPSSTLRVIKWFTLPPTPSSTILIRCTLIFCWHGIIAVAEEDGRLEARELLNLDLKTDTAVLSACETARGEIEPGEGLIGLTWAFFVAGASTTIVSQWKVNSGSTTDLMHDFHRNMLKSGIPKAQALRLAALKVRRSALYEHPFYWAPFILVGKS